MESIKNEIRESIIKLKRECQKVKLQNRIELRKIRIKLLKQIKESFKYKRCTLLMNYLDNISTVERLLGNEKKANYINKNRALIGYQTYLAKKRMIRLTIERCSEISARFHSLSVPPVIC